MTLLEIALAITVALGAGAAAGKWAFTKGEKIEDRHRAAGQLASALSKYGLKRIPDLLIDYSVYDWSGLGEGVVEFVKLLNGNPSAVIEEFDTVFDNVLAAKLVTETGRAFIAAKLADAASGADPGVVTDAPAATTK